MKRIGQSDRTPQGLAVRAEVRRGRMSQSERLLESKRISQSGRVSGGGRAQRCGWAAGSASLRRSPRCGDCPALLDPRSHRGTRCVRCAHCAQTAAMSQMTKRVLRTRRPRACAARRRRRRCACRPPAPLREPRSVLGTDPLWFFAKPWAGGRRCASAAPRSAGARGLRIAARRGVERSLSEHRAQAAGAAGCRPCEGDSALAPGHRAPQGSRPAGTTPAVKHRRPHAHGFATLDRKSEGPRGPARGLRARSFMRSAVANAPVSFSLLPIESRRNDPTRCTSASASTPRPAPFSTPTRRYVLLRTDVLMGPFDELPEPAKSRCIACPRPLRRPPWRRQRAGVGLREPAPPGWRGRWRTRPRRRLGPLAHRRSRERG